MKLFITLVFIVQTFSISAQDFSKYFEECHVKGSITIYDYNNKKCITSDSLNSHTGTLPASTFKILNTLIALETGVIKDENEIIKWPGVTDTVKYGYRPDIYHDITVKEAFKYSAVWAYMELAERIGKKRYKEYLKMVNYGNGDISIDEPDFWNYGNFAVSPVDQIKLLIGLHEETLPFSKRTFEIVKEIMKEENSNDHIFRAKTGWTRNSEKDIGWWVGYIEKQDNTYFISTRITKDRNENNPDFGRCRKGITRAVLKELDVIN